MLTKICLSIISIIILIFAIRGVGSFIDSYKEKREFKAKFKEPTYTDTSDNPLTDTVNKKIKRFINHLEFMEEQEKALHNKAYSDLCNICDKIQDARRNEISSEEVYSLLDEFRDEWVTSTFIDYNCRPIFVNDKILFNRTSNNKIIECTVLGCVFKPEGLFECLQLKVKHKNNIIYIPKEVVKTRVKVKD